MREKDPLAEFKALYVVGPSEHGPTKVGISFAPSYRMDQLQVGCWDRLHLFSVSYFYKPRAGMIGAARAFSEIGAMSRNVEEMTHKVFRKCDLMLVGEWADVSVKDAQDTVSKVAEQHGLIEVRRVMDEPVAANLPGSAPPISPRVFDEMVWQDAQEEINKASQCLKYRNA